MNVEDQNGVRTVTFDRLESLNAFTADAAKALTQAIEGVDADQYDAIVLTGEGEAFSAGGDARTDIA